MNKALFTLLLILIFSAPVFAQNKKAAARAAANESEDAMDDDDPRRVTPVFDPGSHTRPIRAMGFSADKSKLLTVGLDYTVQVWSTRTGERLDILRLPGYGREKGYDPSEWSVAAISADGKLVAMGGGQKKLVDSTDIRGVARLVVVDIPNRRVKHIPFRSAGGAVSAMEFSSDGSQLAVAGGHTHLVQIINTGRALQKDELPRQRRREAVFFETGHDKYINCLAFSPDDSHLVVAGNSDFFTLWKIPGKGQAELVRKVPADGLTTAVKWSPDGRQFLRAWVNYFQNPRGLELHSASGESVKKWMFADLPQIGAHAHIADIQFVDNNSVLLSLHGQLQTGRHRAVTLRLDLQTGEARQLFAEPTTSNFLACGTLTQDHELAAVAVSSGLGAVVYRRQTGEIVSRCGNVSPIPNFVGWSAAGQPPGFAWSEQVRPDQPDLRTDSLEFGFNLDIVEPVGDFQSSNYTVATHQMGDWSLRRKEGVAGKLFINNQKMEVGTLTAPKITSFSLVPHGEQPPTIVWAGRSLVDYQSHLWHSKSNGNGLTRFLPRLTLVEDLTPSPDSRFVIVSTGTHRLMIYPLDGSPHPLLSFARVRGEWVIWTPEGYYAASPGGEKMFGWAVGNGQDQFASFYPAEKFSQQFRRPDVIRLAIELGSVELSLKKLEAKPADVEQILPPHAELKLLKQTGQTVQVRAVAQSGVKDKPVVAMRVLLDGRSLGEGRGSLTVPAGKPAEATWEFEVPAGPHELTLLARSADGPAASDPLIVTGPKTPGQQPVLHRLCVGVNDYDVAGLRLTAAAKDATDVHAALEKYCVGPNNRFGTANGKPLVNREATRAAVLKSLGEIRAAAKPGDLFVFFFAGHGVKQDDKYYLLTREANPAKSLENVSLSGKDLRDELSKIQCPVLLIMDACHSAREVKTFRPSTDEMTRNLTDETAGVTILAAAMAHEVASANQENGYFTSALLKALEAGKGVPFDPYDHSLYAHHIYSVVFSEVRKATNGKQNPFLNMPWTVPPLAIRDVP